MARKRQLGSSALASEIVITDPLPIEDLEDTTVEDYKKLNEKVDRVISKIKGRKEQKRKK
jgi:hypothetical protein